MSQAAVAPYKGLRPFEDTQSDVSFFFGRDRDREIIVANLVAARLTVLYGETGVGKSSVLRAGVAHELRAEAKRQRDRGMQAQAVCVFDAWRDDPVEGVAAAAARAVGEVMGSDLDPEASRGSLADRLDEWTRILDGDLYLVLDQTEEFFLYHEPDGSRSPFVEALADVVRRPGLRVSVLLSLREDAVAKLDRFKGPIPNVLGNYLRLDYLDRASGRGAIVGPIERYNSLGGERVEIEDALVDAVLHEVATGRLELGQVGRGTVEGRGPNGRVETPFLQLVMQRLWNEERASGSRLLRLSTLRELGGAEQIVRDHLNQSMRGLTADDKDVAASVFDHLVTPSGTKIAHRTADLARYAGVDERRVGPLLTRLTDARILRPVAGEGDVSRFEIYHDVLGPAVLAWRTSHESERAVARERERARRRHRRLLTALGVGAILLAAMAGVTAYALTQRNEAQTQAANADAAREEAQQNAAVARAREAEAKAQRANAERQQAAAEAQKARAEQAGRVARDEAAKATRARQRAEESEASAVQSADEAKAAQRRSDASADEARQARARAEAEAANARRQEAKAQEARAQATTSARQAEARALAARALALQATRPLESLRLALSAALRDETRPRLAETVLRGALAGSRVRSVLPVGNGPVNDASFSPNGRLVIGVGRWTKIYDARTGEPLRTLAGRGLVRAASFSPNGRVVVTAHANGTAWLTPVRGGAPLLLRGHTRAVVDAKFSGSGRLLVTAGDDRRAMVWLTESGERLSVLEHDGVVQSAALSPDEKLVVTVSRVATTGRLLARLFDATTGQSLLTLDQRGIRSAIFTPDGSSVVTTSNDNTTRFWDPVTGAARFVLPQDEDVVSATFSPDGTRLVTPDEGGSAYVWQLVQGEWARAVVLVGALNLLTDASFSPDGRFIAISSLDRTIRIYRAAFGLPVAVLAGHANGVTAASFGPDGRSLVSASNDGTARVWDPGTEDLLELVGRKNDRAIRRASFGRDGKLAVSAGADGTARILDVGRRAELEVLRHDAAVNDAQFNGRGTRVVTASDDGTARIWEVGGALSSVLRHDAAVLRAMFSPDGSKIATASADRTVRIWSSGNGRLVRTLAGHEGAVLDVAWSRDGELVASGGDSGDRTARVWRVDGSEAHVLRHRGPVVRVSFSPDGRLLVTASGDEKARLWNVRTGKLVHALRGHMEFVRDAEFSPDGRRVVTASDDRDARIWSVSTGKTLAILRGHFRGPQTASFSPDGRWVVTTGRIAVGLWDASTGRFFAPTGLAADPFIRGHSSGPLTSAVFAPDGRRILSAGGDGTVRTFACELCGRTADLIRIARERLRALERPLTPDERRRYLRG